MKLSDEDIEERLSDLREEFKLSSGVEREIIKRRARAFLIIKERRRKKYARR